MDDVIGDDTRMWMFNRNLFALQDGENLVQPTYYPFQLRFRELENTATFDKSTYVQAFKQMRMYNDEEFARQSAGEVSEEIYYLRGGASNAVDGFLIFEVNKNSEPDNMQVLGTFYSFGFSNWRLRL